MTTKDTAEETIDLRFVVSTEAQLARTAGDLGVYKLMAGVSTHWIVAHNAPEALRVLQDYFGIGPLWADTERGGLRVQRLADDHVLTFQFADTEHKQQVRSAAEWARRRGSVGRLGWRLGE